MVEHEGGSEPQRAGVLAAVRPVTKLSLGWGCVPIGIELFANMIYVGRTMIPKNSHRSQPAAVRQVKLFSDF